MLTDSEASVFEDTRPRLLGLAYRILGTVADAEDAVQDTFLKWANADRDEIASPASWLTTTCTRRCLDLLKAAHRSRVSYVGAWLPEPIQKAVGDESGEGLELAASLKTAFLLMLERLTPKERAAYLLHDVFEMPYDEIAQTLDTREAACRKLVSRAKANISKADIRHSTPVERQNELLSAFHAAIADGSTGSLASLLSDDVRLTVDGGGKVPAILEVLKGRADVMNFLTEKLHVYWKGRDWDDVDINGERGYVIRLGQQIAASVTFAYCESGKVTDVFIMRNPEKLRNLGEMPIH